MSLHHQHLNSKVMFKSKKSDAEDEEEEAMNDLLADQEGCTDEEYDRIVEQYTRLAHSSGYINVKYSF